MFYRAVSILAGLRVVLIAVFIAVCNLAFSYDIRYYNLYELINSKCKTSLNEITPLCLNTNYHNKAIRKRAFPWDVDNIGLMTNLNNMFATVPFVNSDFVEFSEEVYTHYYLNKVELWQFQRSIYFYVSMKDIRNNRGFLQFVVPFQNFSSFLEHKSDKNEQINRN